MVSRALFLAILATLAACTQPVHVLQAGPHTWHVVGDTRYLVRDGERFASTRDDVDMTWSQTCPD